MILIVCLDKNGGMMFNHRRQSKDRYVIKDLLNETSGQYLRINKYSATLFELASNDLYISDDFLVNAEKDDFCFIENTKVAPYIDKIKQVIVYRWDRKYPSDQVFDLDLKLFKIKKIEEFKGYSHDVIQKEIYEVDHEKN